MPPAVGISSYGFTILLLLLSLLIVITEARPLLSQTEIEKAWNYLVQYGYTRSGEPFSQSELSSAIADFAKDVGVADDEKNIHRLIALMKLSRCSQKYDGVQFKNGNTDDVTNAFQRKKRFVAHISKWELTDLSWRFRDPFNLFNDLRDFEIVRQTVHHALNMWSQASGYSLKFTDKSYDNNSTVNIDTFFAVGDHGDHEAFDGRGGIVAHSGYPMVGKIHFDADELWTIEGSKGIDLRYVTLHEAGHALGLRHSKHKDAIMYPIYRKNPTEIALSDDDTNGIRYLYDVGERNRTKRYRRPLRTLYKNVDFEA